MSDVLLDVFVIFLVFRGTTTTQMWIKTETFGNSFTDGLTEVLDAVAGLVERPGVELEPDDGEDEDGEHDEERDLHERRQRLEDGLQHDLQTCSVQGEGEKEAG